MKILTGDISNAFIQATTKEMCYSICGPEWSENKDKVIIIKKAHYELTTSAAQWQNLFADFLQSLGFKPCCYDRDVC